MNHYNEALDVISTVTTELNAIKSWLNLTDEDLAANFAKEIAYLEGLKRVPVTETLKIHYVRHLDHLFQFW
jgi:hypothetical protein